MRLASLMASRTKGLLKPVSSDPTDINTHHSKAMFMKILQTQVKSQTVGCPLEDMCLEKVILIAININNQLNHI